MSGYCADCGNTLCICDEAEEAEQAKLRAGIAQPYASPWPQAAHTMPYACPDCATLRAERDEARILGSRYAAERETALAERDEARRWRMPSVDADLDAFEAVLVELENEDRSWMTRADLIAHYTCAIANWNICLAERDALQARLAAAERVVEAARQAYAADAVHDWFDAEGDGLKAALVAYDAARGGA